MAQVNRVKKSALDLPHPISNRYVTPEQFAVMRQKSYVKAERDKETYFSNFNSPIFEISCSCRFVYLQVDMNWK